VSRGWALLLAVLLLWPATSEGRLGGGETYCQARITSGEFGWVLSRIEQEGSY
jgi:hypothetical protein